LDWEGGIDGIDIKPERLWLTLHPDCREKWVQERIPPGAGRLDLLLQDPATQRRSAVELQLGATNEGHEIRTIAHGYRARFAEARALLFSAAFMIAVLAADVTRPSLEMPTRGVL
jgi:hypothetical protein